MLGEWKKLADKVVDAAKLSNHRLLAVQVRKTLELVGSLIHLVNHKLILAFYQDILFSTLGMPLLFKSIPVADKDLFILLVNKNFLTIKVRGPSYLGLTWSIS